MVRGYIEEEISNLIKRVKGNVAGHGKLLITRTFVFLIFFFIQ